MATIKERNGKYIVIYDYKDEKGARKQKWETCETKADAKKFKAQVEADKLNNTLLIPSAQKFANFAIEWADIYGKANWRSSTYTTSVGIVKNHIIPEIGHLEVGKIVPKDIEMMMDRLSAKKVNNPSTQNMLEEDKPFLSGTTLKYIHMLTKQAFEKAVEWKLTQENPVKIAAPKRSTTERQVWHPEMVRVALDHICSILLFTYLSYVHFALVKLWG